MSSKAFSKGIVEIINSSKNKDRVENEDIHCVLAEPQYKVGLVKAVIEGTHANMAVIDPLGVGLEAGPTLYDKLIRNLATNLSKCF